MYYYFLIVTLLVVQGQAGSERDVSGQVPAPGTLNPSDTVCQKGWKRFENSTHCLKDFSEKMPYNEARKTCQEVGGDLAQSDSEAKNRFVRALFPTTFGVWIGVVYEKQDQQWAYEDGTPMNYSNWMDGQPTTATNRLCASIWSGDNWVNDDCDSQRAFVCEQDTDTSVSYLKNEIVKLKQELKSKDEACEKKLQPLQALFTKSDQEHETKLKALKNLIIKVEDERETTVRFAATHVPKSGDMYNRGRTLVYGNVITNVNLGYSPSVGTFTAPVPGYYFFSLSVYTNGKQHLFVDLKNKRGKILATLRSGDGAGWYAQGTATCIIKMAVGDQVKPVISDKYGRSPVATRYENDLLNLFYGYLLKRL